MCHQKSDPRIFVSWRESAQSEKGMMVFSAAEKLHDDGYNLNDL